MKSLFTSTFFNVNRSKLRELFTGKAPILITANSALQRNSDNNYRFRQDSSFWYLTGIETPGALLFIDKDKEYIILPEQSPVELIFGEAHNPEEISNRSGVANVLSEKEGWKLIESRLKKVSHIATLSAPKPFSSHHGFYTNPAKAELLNKVKQINPLITPLDLRNHLANMRVIKQPEELEAITRAVDITVSAVDKISKKLQKYNYEYEIEADLLNYFYAKGAKCSFNPVIASGANTTVLHYQRNNQLIDQSRLIYLDVGAEVENYAADITRTYFLSEPKPRERNIYNAVEEVSNFVIDRLKPGLSLRDNEKVVEQLMGEKLRELGLIKTIESKNVRQFYPHACSHYLGLDVHDVGDYERPLQPGMVLTVEPGIYIKQENIGVRIENDILITEKGCKVLSHKLK